MMLAFAEEMILEAAEGGQHIVISPPGPPELTPVIVIGGLSAHRDHGVDCGTAADHLAARIGQRAAVETGLGLGAKHPVRTRVADREEIADRDVKPDPVVAAASLKDQDTFAPIRGKAVGDNAARGARADDDIVEFTLEPRCHLDFRPILTVVRPVFLPTPRCPAFSQTYAAPTRVTPVNVIGPI